MDRAEHQSLQLRKLASKYGHDRQHENSAINANDQTGSRVIQAIQVELK
jgi:hypothetical protein